MEIEVARENAGEIDGMDGCRVSYVPTTSSRFAPYRLVVEVAGCDRQAVVGDRIEETGDGRLRIVKKAHTHLMATKLEKDATVVDHLSGRDYLVEFDNGIQAKVYTSGNIRSHHIDVREQDRVQVEVDAHALQGIDEENDGRQSGHVGRIVCRYDVE